MTAGGRPGDYDLDRGREDGVLVMGLVVGVAVVASSGMGYINDPCLPAVALALSLMEYASRRTRGEATATSSGTNTTTNTSTAPQEAGSGPPNLEVGWCQLTIYWVVVDRFMCLARHLLEAEAGIVLDSETRLWLFICQCVWLLLMALIAAATLSQAWSAELQAAVIRMRTAPHR
jgi:hypothetical protein